MRAHQFEPEIDEAFWGPAPGRWRSPSTSAVVNTMVAALALVIVTTVAALVVLWPDEEATRLPSIAVPRTEGARVTHVSSRRCSLASAQLCELVTARLLTGPGTGRRALFDFMPTQGAAPIAVGDRVRLFRNPPPAKGTPAAARPPPYSFSDFDHKPPLLWLEIAFVALLLATGRPHGLRALIGLGTSLPIVLEFAIPSIVDGNSAVDRTASSTTSDSQRPPTSTASSAPSPRTWSSSATITGRSISASADVAS